MPKNLKGHYSIWCNLILFCYLTVYYSWLESKEWGEGIVLGQGKSVKEMPESIMNCQKWIFEINGEIIGSLQNLKALMELVLKNM